MNNGEEIQAGEAGETEEITSVSALDRLINQDIVPDVDEEQADPQGTPSVESAGAPAAESEKDDKGAETEAQPAKAVVTAQPEAAKQVLSEADIQRITEATSRKAATTAQETPKAPAKPYTVDDLYRDTKRPTVTSDTVRDLFSADTPEKQKEILQQLLDDTAKHAFLVAKLQLEQDKKALREEVENRFKTVSPILEERKRAEEERAKKEMEELFATKHPTLAGHLGIAHLAANELSTKGAFANVTDVNVALKLVADRTAEILKSSGITISDKPATPSAPTSNVPKAQKTATGGRSQSEIKGKKANTFDLLLNAE